MFERFSSSSRRVVVGAEAEARALGHNFIGTEHLVLALAGELAAGSRAHDLLIGSGVDLDELREGVRTMVGAGSGPVTDDSIPFTPRTKKVLELSLRESLALGQPAIEPEHILLGILQEGDGVGARLLVDRSVTMELVRSQLGGRLGPRIRPWRRFQAVAVPGMTAGGLRAMAESRRAAGSQPSTVGTRELLLGLLAEGGGVAAQVLARLGVTKEAVEAAAAEVDVGATSDAPPAAPRVEISDEVYIRVPDPELGRRLRAAGRSNDDIAAAVRKMLDDLAG